MNVVDSSGWLAYFADEPSAEYFAAAIENVDELVVPVICVYEVFKVILREKGEDEAFLAFAAMQQGIVVNVDTNVALEAAAVGLRENLAFADGIIYTIAQSYKATLWTQDEHFQGKANVNYTPKLKAV